MGLSFYGDYHSNREARLYAAVHPYKLLYADFRKGSLSSIKHNLCVCFYILED